MEKIAKLKNKKLSFSILILFALVLVLVCSFVLYFYVNEYRKYKTVESDFYYYYSKTKVEFKATLTLNSKDKVLSIEKEGLDLTSYPIYYDNSDKMLLPKNMELVYPYKSKSLYKLGEFSELLYKGKYLYTNSEYGIGRLYDCFLYDGNNLYVFIEPTTIFVNDIKYDLSELSYVVVGVDGVEIYNKKEDSLIYLDNINSKTSVYAYTDEYMINLSNDTYYYQDSYYTLIKNVDGLDSIEF